MLLQLPLLDVQIYRLLALLLGDLAASQVCTLAYNIIPEGQNHVRLLLEFLALQQRNIRSVVVRLGNHRYFLSI